MNPIKIKKKTIEVWIIDNLRCHLGCRWIIDAKCSLFNREYLYYRFWDNPPCYGRLQQCKDAFPKNLKKKEKNIEKF